MIPPAARLAIVVLVALVWAGNIGAGIVLPHYKPDPAINGVFLAVVGGVFAAGREDNRRD